MGMRIKPEIHSCWHGFPQTRRSLPDRPLALIQTILPRPDKQQREKENRQLDGMRSRLPSLPLSQDHHRRDKQRNKQQPARRPEQKTPGSPARTPASPRAPPSTPRTPARSEFPHTASPPPACATRARPPPACAIVDVKVKRPERHPQDKQPPFAKPGQ